METAEMVLRMVLVGLGATLIMDLSALIQARVFGSASLDYRLVGRWLGHMPKGQFRHASIVAAHPTWHESLIGWGSITSPAASSRWCFWHSKGRPGSAAPR